MNQDEFTKYLELIESLEEKEFLTHEDCETIKSLAEHEESSIRYEIAGLLCNDVVRFEETLVQLLNDSDDLVRTNACDSLCYSSSLSVLHLLMEKTLKDKSSLVRGHAATAAADVAIRAEYDVDEMKAFYTKALNKERVKRTKYYYYESLFSVSGEKQYFEILIKGLESRSYHTRCGITNYFRYMLLDGQLSEDYIGRLKKIYLDMLETETTVAVKGDIERFLKEAENY